MYKNKKQSELPKHIFPEGLQIPRKRNRMFAPRLHFLACILCKNYSAEHASMLQIYLINFTITTSSSHSR